MDRREGVAARKLQLSAVSGVSDDFEESNESSSVAAGAPEGGKSRVAAGRAPRASAFNESAPHCRAGVGLFPPTSESAGCGGVHAMRMEAPRHGEAPWPLRE
jgi:hypothetical protein